MFGLDKKDFQYLLLLSLLTFCLNILGLGVLEYFRHTEADRTLIAWEMYESGDYLTPKLIHSVILTKPPLYYWTLALSFKFFGAVTEFTARFPSVIISVLFACLQYLFWRKCQENHGRSFFASIALITGMFFFLQSSVAEIDILFGFLCTLAFYFSYFSISKNSLFLTLNSYFAAALAFLTKGAPIIFFFVAIHFSFFTFFAYQQRKKGLIKLIWKFIWQNLLGITLFLAIIFPWLYYIAQKFGWQELIRQYNIEVAQRFVIEKNHPRGPFYYLEILIGELAPWTIIYLAVFANWAYAFYKKRKIALNWQKQNLNFIIFNSLAVILALLMLTIAKGKSARYIFPVYACCINLLPFFIDQLKNTALEKKLFALGEWFAIISSLGVLIMMFFWRLPEVSQENIIFSGLLLLLALLVIHFSCKKENSKQLLLGTIILFFAIRTGLTYVFYTYRNNEKSVKGIALEINEILPKGAIIYNIEFFERWITYYLKHLGRETWRLTPEESLNPQNYNNRVYLLFLEEEEGWRLEQLKEIDPSTKLLKSFKDKNNVFLLVEADKNSMKLMKPHSHFPTVPSEPFYNDPNKNRVIS